MSNLSLMPIAAVLGASLLVGCGETARLTVDAGTGPRPTLPAPNKTLIPTVHIAPAKGWAEGAKPAVAAGLTVVPFAKASSIRAGSTCCRTATSWSPKRTRRRSRRTARA
jgi:hypothetical protein